MNDPVNAAFHHFYHADKANAEIHMSAVRFSPITFRLAERQSVGQNTLFPPCVHVDEVMNHRGKYPEDAGRVEQDPHLPEPNFYAADHLAMPPGFGEADGI